MLTSKKEVIIMQAAMTISEKQLSTIGEYIKERIGGWIHEMSAIRPQYDPALLERMVRVEEELKHQRDLMIKGFEAMDKRFETMQEQMDKRFDAVDKRFEAADKRFSELTNRIDHFMIWSLGVMISIASISVAVLKYL